MYGGNSEKSVLNFAYTGKAQSVTLEPGKYVLECWGAQGGYDHVIDTYVKYEKILEENGMENGRVTSSMEFINDKYKKLMSVGFDHDKLEE